MRRPLAMSEPAVSSWLPFRPDRIAIRLAQPERLAELQGAGRAHVTRGAPGLDVLGGERDLGGRAAVDRESPVVAPEIPIRRHAVLPLGEVVAPHVRAVR